VAYCALSRHVLLGYEPGSINTSLLTIDCLSIIRHRCLSPFHPDFIDIDDQN
jgi:hypothetical protein